MSSYLGFVAQSSMAVPLGLKSSFLLFESWDILLFSVPTASHGISFFPCASCLGHTSERPSNSVRVTSDGKLEFTHRFQTRESLDPPKWKPISTLWTSTILVLDKGRRLWCLQKRLPISRSCVINASGGSFKFFHFPEAVRQKERRQRWKGSCHRIASFVYTNDSYVHKNKQEKTTEMLVFLYLVRFDFL